MSILKIIFFAFAFYFIRRVWSIYKMVKNAQVQARTAGGQSSTAEQQGDIVEAEYTVLSQENP